MADISKFYDISKLKKYEDCIANNITDLSIIIKSKEE